MKKRDLILLVSRIAIATTIDDDADKPETVALHIGKLLRAATSLRTIAVKMTQVDNPNARQRLSAQEEKKRSYVTKLAERLCIEAKFNDDDVRGFPVFLVLPGNPSNDPGNIGWGIG